MVPSKLILAVEQAQRIQEFAPHCPQQPQHRASREDRMRGSGTARNVLFPLLGPPSSSLSLSLSLSVSQTLSAPPELSLAVRELCSLCAELSPLLAYLQLHACLWTPAVSERVSLLSQTMGEAEQALQELSRISVSFSRSHSHTPKPAPRRRWWRCVSDFVSDRLLCASAAAQDVVMPHTDTHTQTHTDTHGLPSHAAHSPLALIALALAHDRVARHTHALRLAHCAARLLTLGREIYNITLNARPPPLYFVKTLEGHRGRVNCVREVCELRQLVSGSDDKTIVVWDLAEGAQRSAQGVLVAHSGAVLALAVLRCAVSLSAENSHNSHSLSSSALSSSVPSEGASVSPHHRERHTHYHSRYTHTEDREREEVLLISGGVDKRLVVWSLCSARKLCELSDAHRLAVTALEPVRDVTLVSGGREGEIRLWDVAALVHNERAREKERETQSRAHNHTRNHTHTHRPQRALIKSVHAHDGGVESLSLSVDLSLLVSCGRDGDVCLWDLDSLLCVRRIHTDTVLCGVTLCVHTRLVTPTHRNLQSTHSSLTTAEEREQDRERKEELLVAAVATDGSVRVWEVSDGDATMCEISTHNSVCDKASVRSGFRGSILAVSPSATNTFTLSHVNKRFSERDKAAASLSPVLVSTARADDCLFGLHDCTGRALSVCAHRKREDPHSHAGQERATVLLRVTNANQLVAGCEDGDIEIWGFSHELFSSPAQKTL